MGSPTGTHSVVYTQADCQSTAQTFNGVYKPEAPFYCNTSSTA